MTADLFRREALEFRSRQQGPGAVLRATAAWVRWLYWIVLVLLVAGLALMFFVRMDRSTSGPALVNPQTRTFVAVLPAVANSDLQSGHPLQLEVVGRSRRLAVAAWTLHTEEANDAQVHRAGFGSFPQPAILVSGALASDGAEPAATPTSPRLTGRAVVVLSSKPVFSLFLHGFGGASGEGNS
jgi:hypothetical protein